jgi:hypothetical protein
MKAFQVDKHRRTPPPTHQPLGQISSAAKAQTTATGSNTKLPAVGSSYSTMLWHGRDTPAKPLANSCSSFEFNPI